MYCAGLPAHDKERSPGQVRVIGKAAGGKAQNRTWDSRMAPGRQAEVGEGDRENHAAQEDKQQRKHRGKPEGRGKDNKKEVSGKLRQKT